MTFHPPLLQLQFNTHNSMSIGALNMIDTYALFNRFQLTGNCHLSEAVCFRVWRISYLNFGFGTSIRIIIIMVSAPFKDPVLFSNSFIHHHCPLFLVFLLSFSMQLRIQLDQYLPRGDISMDILFDMTEIRKIANAIDFFLNSM